MLTRATQRGPFLVCRCLIIAITNDRHWKQKIGKLRLQSLSVISGHESMAQGNDTSKQWALPDLVESHLVDSKPFT